VKRRRLLLIAGCALVCYVVVGVYHASYRPEHSDTYLWGVYHVHSTHSDGLGTLDQIAGEARESRVDFVIVSDHGQPNPDSSTIDTEIQGVRFIGGSEADIVEGHIALFGVDEVPLFKLPPHPRDAFDDVREWGGVGVLTYPDDPKQGWRYWKDDFVPDGIEIINISSYVWRAPWWRNLGKVLMMPFAHHHLVEGIADPTVPLQRWDELLERGKVFGFYAANAHGGFKPVWAGARGIRKPSYSDIFSLVGLAVGRENGGSVDAALRRGEFFSVIRGAGEPQRFDFRAERDGETYPSGSSTTGRPDLVVEVDTLDLDTSIVLKHDGGSVATTTGNVLRFTPQVPGVYRAEVYLRGHRYLSSEVPWILSNPIFVDVAFAPIPGVEEGCRTTRRIPFDELRVEKDRDSKASYSVSDGRATLAYHLAEATPEVVDRWVALALRRGIDLSPFRGFYLSGESPDYMRYQVEIRSGERRFYSSFKLNAGRHERVFAPFSEFCTPAGCGAPIPLAEIDSIFVTVNTSSTVTGFRSSITIDELGFCD
jgi:hypothetical protein